MRKVNNNNTHFNIVILHNNVVQNLCTIVKNENCEILLYNKRTFILKYLDKELVTSNINNDNTLTRIFLIVYNNKKYLFEYSEVNTFCYFIHYLISCINNCNIIYENDIKIANIITKYQIE